MDHLAPHPCLFTPQICFAWDSDQEGYRCLLCNVMATSGHVKSKKHVNNITWYTSCPSDDSELIVTNTYMENKRAQLCRLANVGAGNQLPPPPAPPQVALPVRALPAQPAPQPNSEQPNIVISIPVHLAVQLFVLLNHALYGQQANAQ